MPMSKDLTQSRAATRHSLTAAMALVLMHTAGEVSAADATAISKVRRGFKWGDCPAAEKTQGPTGFRAISDAMGRFGTALEAELQAKFGDKFQTMREAKCESAQDVVDFIDSVKTAGKSTEFNTSESSKRKDGTYTQKTAQYPTWYTDGRALVEACKFYRKQALALWGDDIDTLVPTEQPATPRKGKSKAQKELEAVKAALVRLGIEDEVQAEIGTQQELALV